MRKIRLLEHPVSGHPNMIRRWRVYCTQFASCRWAGYRRAATREQAAEKPCPRCGKEVAS